MNRIAGRIAFLACSVMLSIISSSQAAEIRVSAFGDFTFGANSSNVANRGQALLFDQYGVSSDPVNTNEGFGVVGTDFVFIVDVNEQLTYLAEINIQTSRGERSEIEIDPERFFVNYRFSDAFNIQPGLYFTPIGYHNRFQYSRAWLMNSVQVPDLFEEDYNLVPTHTIGVAFHGDLFFADGHRLNYIASVGNGRTYVPNAAVYSKDDTDSKEFTGLLEWNIPKFKDFRFAISGWVDQIETIKLDNFGDTGDLDTGESIRLREVGFNPYVVLKSKTFDFVAEYVLAHQSDRLGNLANKTYELNGLFAEVSLNLMEQKFHPYIRYDSTRLPTNGGPYYPLRDGGDGVERLFVPDANSLFLGASYDISSNARLKVQYANNIDGPRAKHSVVTQMAFGF